MKKSAVLVFIACTVGACLHGIAAAPAGSPAPVKKAEKPAKKKEDKSPTTNLFGSSAARLPSNEPVTTQIYADEAFFDSTKNMGIFSGRVKVIDPRFNLQSDKLTVFITKGQNQSLEKAIAEGNVGLVRDRPDPNGAPGAPGRIPGPAAIELPSATYRLLIGWGSTPAPRTASGSARRGGPDSRR